MRFRFQVPGFIPGFMLYLLWLLCAFRAFCAPMVSSRKITINFFMKYPIPTNRHAMDECTFPNMRFRFQVPGFIPGFMLYLLWLLCAFRAFCAPMFSSRKIPINFFMKYPIPTNRHAMDECTFPFPTLRSSVLDFLPISMFCLLWLLCAFRAFCAPMVSSRKMTINFFMKYPIPTNRHAMNECTFPNMRFTFSSFRFQEE